MDSVNSNEQNFVPVPVPSKWQRLVLGLKKLSPSKKFLLYGSFGLAVVAIAIAIYLIFAIANSEFFFSPLSDSWLNGSLDNQIQIKIYAGDGHDIKNFKMTINYTDDIFSGADEDTQIEVSNSEPSNYQSDINRTNNTITISNKNPLNPILGANQELILPVKIIVDVPNSASAGSTFKLTFSGDNKVYLTDGSEITPTFIGATFTVISSDNIIYLNPNSISAEKGTAFNVQVKINSTNQDVIALTMKIKYDPTLLSITVEDAANFPVVGEETFTTNGQSEITLVRGTYGNAIDNDGTTEPERNKTGFKGTNGTIATLRIVGLKQGTADISLSDIQVVKDDGQGTLVTAFEQSSTGTYTITAVPSAQLQITDGPNANITNVHQVNEVWQADVDFTWTTNLAADSTVCCDGSKVCPTDSNLIVNHVIKWPNLTEGSHSCTVTSMSGSLSVSAQSSFVISAPVSTQLQIKNLSASPGYTSAVISWNTIGGPTNGLSDSKVYYAAGGAGVDCQNDSIYPSNPADEDDHLTLSHHLKITGLTAGAPYCVKAVSDNQKSGSENQKATAKTGFTTKIGQEPDANIVLKVQRDRICDQWLYCRSSMEVTNSKGKKENLCFDLGICDELGPDGSCLKTMATARTAEQVFDTPGSVNQIQNLSGLAKVGLKWPNGDKVPGYYQYGAMAPVGSDIDLPNSGFESGEPWPWQLDNPNKGKLTVVRDPEQKSNLVLQGVPNDQVGNGDSFDIKVPIGWVAGIYPYAVTLDLRSGASNPTQTKTVKVQIEVNGIRYTIGDGNGVPVSGYWQTVLLTSEDNGSLLPDNVSGNGFLNLGVQNTSTNEFQSALYVDNVSMKSILPVSSDTKVARTCRLYPSKSAPDCDYADVGGKQYRGWQGFCVERDPNPNLGQEVKLDKKQKMCLNWWPVDILPGETDIFGADEQAGYDYRSPLYYCLESAGNYPYLNLTRSGSSSSQYSSALMYKYCDKGTWAAVIIGATFIPVEIGGGQEICGWEKDSGLWTSRAPEEVRFRETDIERIVLEPLCEGGDSDTDCFSKKSNSNAYLTLDRTNGWEDYLCNGSACQSDSYYKANANLWGLSMLNDNSKCSRMGIDFFAVRASFNQGNFEGLQSGLCNTGGNSGFVRYRTVFYLRETCNVLAQVVSPDGENTAWSDRVREGGWTQENDLKYGYEQDYKPYGGVAQPEPASDPTQWEEPLYVTPADKSAAGAAEPYQVRAGSPYAIKGKAKRCRYNLTQECEIDAECRTNDCGIDKCLLSGDSCGPSPTGFINCPSNTCDLVPLENIGATQCIAGSAENLGKECQDDTDCGVNYEGGGGGRCMGIKLTETQKKNIGGGWQAGEDRLSKLFAKPQSVWKWEWNKYVQVYSSKTGVGQCKNPPPPPGDPFSCPESEKFGWDITSAYGAYKPQVENIKVNDRAGNIEIQGPKTVALKFNSLVDENHLPLVAFRVDWGDGTPMSQVSNLKIYGRPPVYDANGQLDKEKNNPHVLFHTYDKIGNFTPKIQIQDNWGWCSVGENYQGSEKCPLNSDDWAAFKGQVMVK